MSLHCSRRRASSQTARLAHVVTRSLLETTSSPARSRLPRIGVCALNPHAGEQSLFGDEEVRIIRPGGRARDRRRGWICTAPSRLTHFCHEQRPVNSMRLSPCIMTRDTSRSNCWGMHQAVNITLGLPVIRTSVAHGTAYDVAWKGQARCESMMEAIRVAAQLVDRKHLLDWHASPLARSARQSRSLAFALHRSPQPSDVLVGAFIDLLRVIRTVVEQTGAQIGAKADVKQFPRDHDLPVCPRVGISIAPTRFGSTKCHRETTESPDHGPRSMSRRAADGVAASTGRPAHPPESPARCSGSRFASMAGFHRPSRLHTGSCPTVVVAWGHQTRNACRGRPTVWAIRPRPSTTWVEAEHRTGQFGWPHRAVAAD